MYLVEPGAGGRHYSERGHEFVAARLAERLAVPTDQSQPGS
jgi:predicted N-acyltransferase